MNKIKILMVPSDLQGVGHFRNIWPAQIINKKHHNEFKVDINHEINTNNIEYLSSYDIIHFHRQLGDYEKFEALSKELKKRGVILIMDIDDYWEPPVTHPLFEIVKNENLTAKIKNNIKFAHYVTTTTNAFKKHIEKINPNVFVIPNALDMSKKMWENEKVPKTNKCRIAWIGGSSHLHDLNLLKESMNKLNHDSFLKNKYQIVLCGFDTRGTITQILPNGSKSNRKIRPEETIWLKFEEIFTSNYELLKNNTEYIKWLKKIKKQGYEKQYQENYLRRWTLPLTQYGKHYNFCDVCLAPLEELETYKEIIINKENKKEKIKTNIENPIKGTIKTMPHYFNEVKSELKIIETGMKKKVLIAQDFGIYKELIKNGENGLLVSDNKKGWYKAIKQVILNEKLREKLSNNLYQFVKNKYNIINITNERMKIYKDLYKLNLKNKKH